MTEGNWSTDGQRWLLLPDGSWATALVSSAHLPSMSPVGSR